MASCMPSYIPAAPAFVIPFWVAGYVMACEALTRRDDATSERWADEHPWSWDVNVTRASWFGGYTFGFQYGSNGFHPYFGFGAGLQASQSVTFSKSQANTGIYGTIGGCGGGACGEFTTQGNWSAGSGKGIGGSLQVRWGVP